MKSSFLFTRLCVLISILASGTLIFFLLRAIYYPELSVILLLVILLCHLLTSQYKKTHPAATARSATTPHTVIPTEAKKALAIALGGVTALIASKKSKISAAERAVLLSQREALLSIGHYFESVESMRTHEASSLEQAHETTSLTETIIAAVDTRRGAFLKKGIVLMYRNQELKNDYITINQKHLRRIVDTLLQSILKRSVQGRVTLSQSESRAARTISLTVKIASKKVDANASTTSSVVTQYATLERMIARYGGTIECNTENVHTWTTCVCTFPSHT